MSDGTREGGFLRWGGRGRRRNRGQVWGKRGEKRKDGRKNEGETGKGTRTEVRNQVGRGREEGKKSRWEVKKRGKRRKGG